MKRGQIVEGTVEKIEFPNKGVIVLPDGEKVRTKNVIPGQVVQCRIKKNKTHNAEGMLLEIIETSPLESAEDVCPHFGMCGGCIFQTVPYDKQLELKSKMMQDLFLPVLGDDKLKEVYEGVIASPRQAAYRNKMEFSFGDEYKDGPLALGMHKRGSFYDIVTVSDCRIIDEDMRRILEATLNFFGEKSIPYYHKVTHAGYLRHLLVRKAVKTGEIMVDLVTTTEDVDDEVALLNGWKNVLEEIKFDGVLKGVLHTRNDREADVVCDEGTDILLGEDFFYEELLGLRFKITPFSFFQTNSLGAEVLYETAREFIRDSLDGNLEALNGKVLYDLYSGTGTIAQIMSSVCGSVVGVEIVEEAVEAAKVNASLNGISNCEFIAGDVLKTLDDIEVKPDYIILDPPRDGIHPKALEKIISYGVDSMIYISCKPSSLARDLEVLQARGYEVKRMRCVDMFPSTYHVESVVLLSQQKADDYLEVEIDLDELDATSAETKATYEEIKKYVAEHNDGMKVSNLYIAQVKKKCGIELGQNFNLPKSENAKQPQCPKEKEDAIVEALKAFQMI